MCALVPSEELRYDENGNVYTHKVDPKSIQCVLLVMTDELLVGQDTGFPMRDFSRPVDDPEHYFMLKVVLLFFMGDYPGQGKVSNMKHSGAQACHWCHHDFEYHSKGHNVARATRQHLPTGHTYRQDDSFPEPEEKPPPATRTHQGVCDKAAELEGLRGPQLEQAQKTSGVYGACELRRLHLFNIIWDICGDMMHLMSGMWGRRVMPMFKGEFTQAYPKKPGETHADGEGGQMPYNNDEQAARTRGYDKAKHEWAKVKQVPNTPTCTPTYILLINPRVYTRSKRLYTYTTSLVNDHRNSALFTRLCSIYSVVHYYISRALFSTIVHYF